MVSEIHVQINYPAACNAAETLLVNSKVLNSILPAVARGLIEKGVSLRADERSLSAITSALSEPERAKVTAAKDEDFDTEFLELTIAVKTVDSLQEAVTHINTHGSHHTDAIVTEDEEAANFFMGRVDAAGTYWNASTRFADGFRYGFGAEIGVRVVVFETFHVTLLIMYFTGKHKQNTCSRTRRFGRTGVVQIPPVWKGTRGRDVR